jgi:hypothetical protein
MRDTPPDVDAAFTALFAPCSGSERVQMACAMFDDAKALVEANIRAEHPGIAPAELRVKVFERLYFDDFDPGTRARIVAALSAPAPADSESR